jgi:putative ATPase
MDLFDESGIENLAGRAPLAERLRPANLDEVVGQPHLTDDGGPLRSVVDRGRIGSIVLWGPPGTGKTTLARVLANTVEEEFVPLSAVTSGVKDLRAALDGARERLKYEGHGTLVFVDEVHRFNKTQQDREPLLRGNGPAALPLTRAQAAVTLGRRSRRAARQGRGRARSGCLR